jgi:hypothetical protein
MPYSTAADRRRFLERFAGLGLSSTLFAGVLWAQLQQSRTSRITKVMLRDAAAVAGMTFTERELDAMLDAVNIEVARFDQIRKAPLENAAALPLYFNPAVPGIKIDRTKRPIRTSAPPPVTRPHHLEDIAFRTIPELASLMRTRQVKSAELTAMISTG